MEQENNNTTESILNKKVGDIEQEKKTLAPAQVTISSIVEQTEKSDGTAMSIALMKVAVKHPDKDELISISKVKTIKDDKIITRSLWKQLDKEDNIQKGSAIDDLLKFLKCDSLADTYNKEIETVIESEDSSFLCLKAY